jgi:predicted lipid-binding transport protein (Tim44 family)
MKKEQQDDKQFLGGLLIGIILGAMIGYFTFRIVTAVQNSPIKEAQEEHLERKMIDWSKHPNKDKKAYFEVMYNHSSKN